MPSSTANGTSSPSASSIFLPLGRRSHRDSKSSISNPLGRDALNDALDTIHSAASQSQVLTVFNEYTEPPPANSSHEAKGLAGELQGGLSGFYNKLRATVGGAKDNPEVAVSSPELRPKIDGVELEQPQSKQSSGRVSRVQSPRVLAFDSPRGVDAASQSSIISSKATSNSKVSLTTPNTLKSPINLPQKGVSVVADSTVVEVNIHAAGNHISHSRGGSGYENRAEFPASAQPVPGVLDDDGLRKIRSHNIGGEADNLRLDKALTSPALVPVKGSERQKSEQRSIHERGPSDQISIKSHDLVSPGPRREALFLSSDDKSIERVASNDLRAPSPATRSIPIPAELRLEDTAGSGRRSPVLESRPMQPSPRTIKSPRPNPADLPSRVSQSRLPGFSASRASSVDTAQVSQDASSVHIRFNDTFDKHNERSEQQSKPGLRKLRSKLLSKEFWMRDENARDCFHCGESFSTFRRKHHCRTCGQIFDSKCTVLISGHHFGSSNHVRVCKPCEAFIATQEDDSSDYSIEDLALPDPAHRPRTPITHQHLQALPRDDDTASVYSLSLEQMSKTPTMSFPLRRAVDSGSRNSAVLEFDTVERSLARPSSSRSLKTSHSIGHVHKRHHSRHQYIRSFKSYHEDRAPFQKRVTEVIPKGLMNSAFHRDSVIDPDLAQYLSDDASSADEDSDQSRGGQSKFSRSAPDNEKATIGGLLAAVRKGRSRIGERSIVGLLNIGREADDASVTSSRVANHQRSSRKRNLSVSSSIQRTTPRTTRESLHLMIPDERGSTRPVSPSPAIPNRGTKLIRSASMRAMNAPSMELNRASLHHVHMLLQQLLRDARVAHASSWEKALVPILLRATDDVDPDVQAGDDIDIRNYVKLKKIPGGRPGDTSYVSGLIFTKNVALKSMSRSIMDPRILIITFPLEYARHEQHFMSLDPVIRQEREYLANLVGRIAALKPDLLLAERNISGLALELLDAANIATAFNVKSTVLEAVSRCTQTRIIHSMDKLTTQPGQLGMCDNFEVKTYVAEGKKKTYIYLSGCPPQLGCTIALRGADRRTLTKVKRITDFMVYVVYNLKLETCLMRDEWALIPNTAAEGSNEESQKQKELGNPTTDVLKSSRDDKVFVADREDDTKPVPTTEDVSNADVIQATKGEAPPAVQRFDSEGSGEIPDDVPVPTFYEDLVEKHQTKILSASPFVKFMQPYLLMRARELERRVAYLKRLRDQDISAEQSPDDKNKTQKFTLIQPEMVHASLAGAGKKVREILHAVHDTEYDKALHNYETQKRQWETYLSGNKNLFDPYAHQNVVVLFSQVSTATSVPCVGPDILAFSFYNEHETDEEFEADCTLGQYVEDLCFKANDICPSNACEKLLHEHHRQYVHGEAQISVFVHPCPAKLRGMQNTVLMWSQCRVCGVETPVTPMSMSTWKYSFGKYLETSIWSAGLRARAGICPHDLHRDHLRYFGYKDFALRIHYDSIDLLEIIVPRLRITWKVDNDLRFRNEVYSRIEQRLTRFMVSVKLRLKSINVDALLPENAEACRVEIEILTKRANEEHAALVKQLQERYSNSKHWETIPLNRSVRATMEKVGEWDNAFAEFEKNFFPSEKDIRRLATLQLKKIFLDRDVSVTSLASTEEGTITPPSEVYTDEKGAISIDTDQTTRPRRATILSPEKTQNVLQSVVEEHSSPSTKHESSVEKQQQQGLGQTIADLPQLPQVDLTEQDVEHLDLALPVGLPQLRIQPETDPSFGSNELRSSSPHGSGRDRVVHIPSPLSQPIQSPGITEAGEQATSTRPIDLPSPSATQNLDIDSHRDKNGSSPKLLRAHSQPTNSQLLRRDQVSSSSTVTAIKDSNGFGANVLKPLASPTGLGNEIIPKSNEKKLSDRFGLSHLKASKFVKGHSLIPRAVSGRKESRVSNLAKHFEQLSREFEKERIRERKQRAARSRQSRMYPLAASKPIVEVYKDVDEAVQEKDSADGSFLEDKSNTHENSDLPGVVAGMARTNPSANAGEGFHAEETPAETSEFDADAQETSRAASDADIDEDHSDDQGSEEVHLPESPEDLLRLSQEDLDLKELPKHERTSLMKMLTNFWAERSSSGWTPLEYPLHPSDHVFADCDIIVREDEPSSIIAFALDSQDYKSMLWDIQDHPGSATDPTVTKSGSTDTQADVMHSLLRKTGTHLKYQFQEGPAKMLCKIFFAEQFDAVRRKCGVSDRIVESLSRCMKWDSKGGKTKSLFLKTLDDRFVLKSLSPIETQSFLKFAPNYFQIMSEAFFHELPSVIAKMLGFYQIIIKNPATGVEYNWFLLVMENLFYDRTPTRIFDLKGSMRNRKIQSTGERNEVLLDENMVEFIYESPLFAREHSKKLLKSSVHNDTLFLARQNVMDYSLMVAIDENRKELVVGIIDCIRTYTWDKKLESWIKDRGFAGGNKNRPTVTSPKEYKKRFREAMGRYVLEAPNCWYQFKPVNVERRLLAVDMRLDGKEVDKGEVEVEVLT